MIERIVESGYRPILAHPERYKGIKPDLSDARAWRSAGAYLQVNHGSFAGRYGPEARTVATELVARGWVDSLSSDFHARAHLGIHLTDAEAYVVARRAHPTAVGGLPAAAEASPVAQAPLSAAKSEASLGSPGPSGTPPSSGGCWRGLL